MKKKTLRIFILGLLLSTVFLTACGGPKKSEFKPDSSKETFGEAKQELIVSDFDKINKDYRLAEGKKKPWFKTDFQLLEADISVLGVDKDNLYAKGGQGNILYRSEDLGESWIKVKSFNKKIEGLHISKKGSLLVCISKGRYEKDAQSELYMTRDLKEFKKVLDLSDGAAINWNMASDEDGYIFVSEYGYKEEPNNARKIYRSKDDGESWETIYDPEPEHHHHNHIVAIDKDDKNIIYQSIGDIYKKVIISKDRGDSWETLIEDINPTAMLQLGDEILFGMDNHPKSGVMRYNKKTAILDYAFETPEPFSGPIYDLLYADGKIYAGLLSYADEKHYWNSSMFMSRDQGKNWEQIMEWPKFNKESGIGIYNMFEKDGYGFMSCTLPCIHKGEPDHYRGTLRFKLID